MKPWSFLIHYGVGGGGLGDLYSLIFEVLYPELTFTGKTFNSYSVSCSEGTLTVEN